MKVIFFILRADENRYKDLLKDLKSSACRGRDEYPTTVTSTFDLLVRESGILDKPIHRSWQGSPTGRGNGRSGVMFAQAGRGRGSDGVSAGRGNGPFTRKNEDNSDEIVPGRDDETKSNIKCFECQFHGHYRGDCLYEGRVGVITVQLGHIFTQEEEMVDIPKSWVLLDTCSVVSVTNNTNLVTNIRDCEHHEYLKAMTNRGSQLYKRLADMILFPIVVHFKKDSMASILSFKDVFAIPGVRITMDTAKEDTIVVTTEEGKVIRFKPYSNGLFYFDTIQHNIPQHYTQHNTTQHNTTQHNTTQHNTTQHNYIRYLITQQNKTKHNTIS